jgi:hypothetical protein
LTLQLAESYLTGPRFRQSSHALRGWRNRRRVHRAIASGASLLPTFAVTTVVVGRDPTRVVINGLMVTPSQTTDGELVIEV